MLFSFSVDSDFIFYIIAAQFQKQLLHVFFNYDFPFILSAITRLCSSRVALRELDRERK